MFNLSDLFGLFQSPTPTTIQPIEEKSAMSYFKDLAIQSAFNPAYWAAQPPEVRQLRDMADNNSRAAASQALADRGFVIDKAIMVWLWDPYEVMLTRWAYGYTWAPNINQGNVSVPGITLIGQTPYDPNNPPAGSIPVHDPNSFDLAAWLPPYAPPPPPPPPPPVKYVDQSKPWPDQGPNAFFATFEGQKPAGPIEEDGKTWTKIVVPNMFSAWYGWKHE